MNSIQPPHRKLETIDDVIDVMYRNLSNLSAMLDHAHEMEAMDDYLKILVVYIRCIAHLPGLLRTKQALAPPANDVLSNIALAVDELAEEQGWTVFSDLNPGSPIPR